MNLTLGSPGKDNKRLPRNDSQILEFFCYENQYWQTTQFIE